MGCGLLPGVHVAGSLGKHTEGHALLAPVYGWFTEGFDTADLQEAKALLEALGERKTQPTLPAV